ncbi:MULTISPECIES: cell division protein SepF [Sporosarcina]|uniref:Cell division protein SepF n=1 Tax=Sporosarcina ureae TaxID=1571 RepID=A0ABN4YT89_SPOUR|nr:MULTISPECIES: cell division protein SepF [Sporosarcina]ARF15254.1 cell division protein SepF [Sporosarcina ureae]
MSLKKRLEKMFWVQEEDLVQQPKPQSKPTKGEQAMARKEMKKLGGKKRAVNSRLQASQQQASSTQAPVISLQSLQKSSKVILLEPRSYAEVEDIAEHLKNRRSVVVNLQQIERDQGFRIIDFLSGTVYALGGDIQRIGADIFLCAPDNVEVAGKITEFLSEQQER